MFERYSATVTSSFSDILNILFAVGSKSISSLYIVLNNDLDFFPMQSFFKDNLISERLKQAIEENGITGFEFSELDYEVIVER